ncbi:MAG: tetratricopeptide repeat protein [Oscillatoriaceae cyanobacterium Prado104]|jgi:chemotaxis protein methyltransferase CheR|nr:tetratricopeptide repeat protein [Oscillatoriaceae cyanobacterium Prado104]
MNDALTHLFVHLISSRIGLQVRPQDRTALSQKILTRMKAIKLAFPEKYYQLLAAQTLESQNEWRQLVLLLTTNESYFMRDKGQFSLLEKVILPELIDRKIKLKKTLGIQPTLRIWSAGCSTGEEPYSLAILLKQLISDWSEWKILVLGSDINEAALEKAKRGVYSDWSFRLVEAQVQSRYFKQQKNEWEIDIKLRNSVEFKSVNLVSDNFPNIYNDIYNMDLIVCRNVFVYFEAKYIALTLKKFAQTLKSGGYLMTGHAELHGQIANEFKPKIFPESVIYQRCDGQQDEFCVIDPGATLGKANWGFEETIKPAADKSDRSLKDTAPTAILLGGSSTEITPILTESTPLGKMLRARYVEGDRATPVSPAKIPETESQKVLAALISEAKNCFKNKAYTEAIKKAQQAIVLHRSNFDSYYLLAQIYANVGEYARAIENCKRASEIDSLSVFPYYLQAHIAEEKGDLATAKKYFKRIIYLCPSFISAYLELGNIYRKEGQLARAVKMYKSSCDILKTLPPNTPIEQQGKITARQMLIDVKKILLALSENWV